MIGFLKEWILNITALVLFLAVIEILMPSGRMKKYCSLITGVILIIVIINPFIRMFDSNFNLEEIQVFNSNAMDRMEIEKNSKILKEEEMKQIVELYRKKIIRQLEENALKSKGVSGAKGDVIINEDYNTDNFGEIKRVYLEITANEEKISPVVKVDDIRIGEEKEPETQTDLEPKLKKQLEDSISSMFGIEKENIVISRKD